MFAHFLLNLLQMENSGTTLAADDPQSTTPPPGRRRRILLGLITMVIGVLIGLVIVEVGLRIVGYSYPEFYMADDVRGYVLIPQMTGWYQKEGRSFVTINSDGFRDVEHTIDKPAGTFRIAVIGDSYVEALQVSQDEMFTNYVRSQVMGCSAFGGKQVEMLSFGVSGYSTAQELLTLREKVLKYSPDVVMLVMTTNNDITDNSRFFKQTPIPYFVLKDGSLSLDDSFRHEKAFMIRNSGPSHLGIWLKNHLRIVQAIGRAQVALKYRYQNWKNQTNTPAAAPAAIDEAAPTAEVGIDSQVYREPSDENWKNAWSVTEGLIALMKAETEVRGAKFAVVTASNGVQVLPTVDYRTAFAKLLGVPDLYYPDRRIADFCKTNSIPVITLAPELGDYAAQHNIFLHGFDDNIGYGHWNTAGHKIAGETIGKHLCEGILR